MSNDVSLGTRRTGNLIDFQSHTPQVTVTFEHDAEGIRIDVPWPSIDDYYASWFMGESIQGLPIEAAIPPKQLLFSDTNGTVLLVGCYANGFTSNFISGVGYIRAPYVITGVDANIDYLKLHGIRSEVSGLYDWLGKGSLNLDPNEGTRRISASIGGLDPTQIDDSLTLSHSWTVEPKGRASITLSEVVQCETRSARPAEWSELQGPHVGVRDLLVVSRWLPETCNIAAVLREDDPVRIITGEAHERWRDVVTGAPMQAPTRALGRQNYLVKFGDIGPTGITRWLALREEFARALDPVISDCFLDRVGPVTHMAQIGPGLEALGYLLFLLRDGATESMANSSTLHQRLERIVQDVGAALPFDGQEWARRTGKSYNGIKHANRQLPSDLDLLNSWRESIMVVRAWIALQLGLDAEMLKRRLMGDPQNSPYVARE